MVSESNLHTAEMEARETFSLIGSDKVEGTPVYRSNGDKIGRIERLMIYKVGGKVAYAIMSFGGSMGIGEDYYPLPWFAVGTAVASRPPHRSVQAGFPHTAPTLSV
ncbi:MAG TPA: PRC-barrel domain-containing protein, partial [Bradyrhizobium sp.]|nr:PRC-barrel domain-containing protein [Bradyrhizobium sp.]